MGLFDWLVGKPKASVQPSAVLPRSEAKRERPFPVAAQERFEALTGSPDVKVLVHGNTAFACDLFARLRGLPGNLFFSPFSISTALAMTLAGAREKTEREMAEVLRLTLPREKLHTAFADLLLDIQARALGEANRLHLANALWKLDEPPVLKSFLALVEERYRSRVTDADFRSNPEGIRREINAWVEEKTEKKIRELLRPGLISEDTRMVLVNAIYFLGKWETPFEKRQTRDQPFHLADGSKITVPTMQRMGTCPYFETEDFQMLELPYKGSGVCMTILLPRRMEDLERLEQSLQAGELARRLRELQAALVTVHLPKFKIEDDFELEEVLLGLGMTEATRPSSADFSGMTGAKFFYIGKVIHKAFVDVDEAGTEAAAATAMLMFCTGLPPKDPPQPKLFRADRPFVFLIRDMGTGSVLFMGRVADPR